MLGQELLSEPVIIPDIFTSGLADIEDLEDGNYRFTFYTRQRSPYGGDENIVVSRLVMPASALIPAIRRTMRVAGYACCGAGRRELRH